MRVPRIVGFLSNIPVLSPLLGQSKTTAFATRLGEIKGIYFQADSNGRRIHRAKRQISLGSASFEFIAFNEQETAKNNRVFSEKIYVTNHLKRRLIIFMFQSSCLHDYVDILVRERQLNRNMCKYKNILMLHCILVY